MPRSDTLIPTLSFGLESTEMLPPQGKTEQKNVFPSNYSKYLRKFRSKLIFKIKTKQPFYALFRVSRGTLGRLEDAVSEFEKKKNWFLCPSGFSKLKFISESPTGRTTKQATGSCPKTYSSLNRKSPHNLNPPWGSNRDDHGQSGSTPIICIGQDKVSFISHFNTMKGHPNYDFYYNQLTAQS